MEEKTTLKQLYEAPAVEVVELKTEGTFVSMKNATLN